MSIKKNIIPILILLFCIWNKFFNFKPFVEAQWYSQLSDVFTVCFVIFLLKEILRKRERFSVANGLSLICIIFFFSILWSYILRGQSFYGSLRALSKLFPVIIFFFLSKYKIGNQQVVKTMAVLCLMYMFFHLSALATYPNHLFGYSEHLMEQAESTMEQRGVLRLGIPGQDFIVAIIFLVLTKFRHKKNFYILLIPLFSMLLLRGTRTPLFVTLVICIIYYLWQIRHKFVTFFIGIVLFAILNIAYEHLLNSNSDDILTNYVQMTALQLENNNDTEDIRIEMSKYYFTQFNDNIFEIIFGNGVPFGKSDYGKEVSRLSNTHLYYLADVGITDIFVLFGVIGLIAYGLLLISVIRTKIDEKYMFAKLYIFYTYLILPTNVSLISLAPMIFAMNLYLVYNGRIKNASRQTV